MKTFFNSIVIVLLSVALGGMTVAREVVSCLPDCSQCEPAVKMSSCDERPHPEAVHDEKTRKPQAAASCCHDELCPELFSQQKEFAVNAPIETEIATARTQLPPTVIHHLFYQPKQSLPPPLPLQAGPIYTLHCAFLI